MVLFLNSGMENRGVSTGKSKLYKRSHSPCLHTGGRRRPRWGCPKALLCISPCLLPQKAVATRGIMELGCTGRVLFALGRRGGAGGGGGSGLPFSCPGSPTSLPAAFVSAALAGQEQETGGGREARQEE